MTQLKGPVVVGGVGGSGTRVVAEVLKALGFYMGNLNTANDNKQFATLFRRPKWFKRQAKQNAQAIYQALQTFEQEMDIARLDRSSYVGWGWKNPVTHIYLPYLNNYFPELKYIHVIRHGLDMAFSGNKKQLQLWGKLYNVNAPKTKDDAPARALDYWITSNNKAIQRGNKLLGERFLIVKYDDLCHNPERVIKEIVAFVEVDRPRVNIEKLCKLVKAPNSIGRYKQHDLRVIEQRQIDAVRKLGFDVKQ